MFNDRRKYMRFDIPLDVEYATSDSKSIYRKGSTNNFSREGLGLISNDYDFENSTSLELKVKHPNQDRSITAMADIAWKTKVGDSWYAGLQIREIDKAAKMDILDIAYDKWVQKIHK